MVGEIQEQERKTLELYAKLQLIEQLTQQVDFITKAYIQGEQDLVAEFAGLFFLFNYDLNFLPAQKGG